MGNSKTTNRLLWIVQWFLALFFILASGAPKLAMPFLPPDSIPLPLPLPMWFVLVIGVCEVSGGLGLILPGLLGKHTHLTAWAAVGLMLITEGATVYQITAGQMGSAAFAVAMGLLAAVVAYGRWRVAPLGTRRSTAPVLGAAR